MVGRKKHVGFDFRPRLTLSSNTKIDVHIRKKRDERKAQVEKKIRKGWRGKEIWRELGMELEKLETEKNQSN